MKNNENQLEDSNHDHLGKLITYASGKKAKAIVWVVKTAREEHREAIKWLNDNTNSDLGFYLLEWTQATKASRFFEIKSFDMADSSTWEEVFKWYIEKCIVLKKIVQKYL